MSVPRRPVGPPPDSPAPRRRSTVVFGEEDGYATVTIKTEVTIVIHDPVDVEEALNATYRSATSGPPVWYTEEIPEAPRWSALGER